MKQWLDYIPLALFFISYKVLEKIYPDNGIYYATGILIASSLLTYGYIWFSEGKLSKNHKFILVMTLVLGGMTLYFHDITFLKWKATIVNWVFAGLFLISHFISDKLAIEHLMGQAMELPKAVWTRLNIAWIFFFLALGGINLYVAFHFSNDTWVNFKLFGNLGITFVFVVGQTLFLSRYLPTEPSENSKN